jgi:hypothetical protein
MACSTNPISQLRLDSPSLAMRLPTNREDLYDVTDSLWVYTRFYSTDGASGMHYMFSQILHLILCVGVHGLGLLATFVA